MADDLPTTLADLRVAVAAFDYDAIEDNIRQLEDFALDEGWGPEWFAAVKSLLADAAFLNAGTSYLLVMDLSVNWEELTATQHQELRPVLAAAFDRFGDWLGAQLVAEIFGERYADEAALETFERLSREAGNGVARAFAVYGIGRLARTFGSGPLYDRAIARLSELTNSTEEDVAQEASEALGWFERRPGRS